MTTSALRTLVLTAPSVSPYGVPAVVPLRWPVSEPAAVLDYSLDVSLVLADTTDTIALASLAVAPSGTGELTPLALGVLGGLITGWLSGGVAGRSYAVRIEITTTAGRSFEWVPVVPLDATLAVYPVTVPPSLDFGTALTWTSGVTPAVPSLSLVADNLTATGTNAATALPLVALTNVFTTVPSGTGTILPATVLSGTVAVMNNASNDLAVYPPAGAIIGSLGANVPILVAANQRVNFMTNRPTVQWWAA